MQEKESTEVFSKLKTYFFVALIGSSLGENKENKKKRLLNEEKSQEQLVA